MKIAIPVFHFHKKGGIERHIWELVSQWEKENEIHIFASRWDETSFKNVFFHKVPVIEKPEFLKGLSFLINNSRMLKRGKFDVIINDGCGTTFVQDIIITESVHKAWAEEFKKKGLKKLFLNPNHYITLFVEKFNYTRRRYKKIICISRFIQEQLIKYHGIPIEDTVVINHGVNLEEFSPLHRQKFYKEKRKQFGFSDKDFVILFVGHELKRKGLYYIFKALELLKDERFKLLIVGAPKSHEVRKFKKIASKMKIISQIFFTGISKNVSEFYAMADVFVFPSVFDAFAMVVLEAMASGLPVITCPTVGASELIENKKDGIILRSYDDVSGLVDNLKFLSQNTDILKKIGKNARLKAEKYSWDRISKETFELLVDVCKNKIN